MGARKERCVDRGPFGSRVTKLEYNNGREKKSTTKCTNKETLKIISYSI